MIKTLDAYLNFHSQMQNANFHFLDANGLINHCNNRHGILPHIMSLNELRIHLMNWENLEEMSHYKGGLSIKTSKYSLLVKEWSNYPTTTCKHSTMMHINIYFVIWMQMVSLAHVKPPPPNGLGGHVMINLQWGNVPLYNWTNNHKCKYNFFLIFVNSCQLIQSWSL